MRRFYSKLSAYNEWSNISNSQFGVQKLNCYICLFNIDVLRLTREEKMEICKEWS